MGVGPAIDITAEERQIILSLLERHLPSTAAWVYGSRANWTSRPQSDLDLVVFATPEQRERVGDLREAFDESNLPFRVDLFVWDEVPDSFRQKIEAEHLVLVRNDSPRLPDCLPTGWGRSTLGAACERGGGNIQTGPFGSQLHASDYRPIGIPSIMPQNIGENRVIEDGIARIGELDARRLARYLVRTGDIVYSRRGDVERRALIGHHEDGWLCGTGCLRVRLGENGVDPQYASYYLGHPVVREWIVRHAHGATMPNLNTAILSACPFLIPPVSEQRTIAHVLGTLDDKIELNRRMNATLEAMARALFKSWFVDFDPVRAKMEGRDTGLPKEVADLFPDRLVDSELGEIPEGWRVGTLAEVARLNPESWSNRTAPDRILYVDLAKTKGGDIDEIQIFSWADAPSRARRVLRRGDTIVGTVRPGNRSFALIDRDDLTGSTGFAVLRPTDPIEREIVWCTATSHDAIDRLAHLADGGAYPAVNPKVVLDSALALPDSDLRTAFSSLVAPLLNRLQANQRETRTLGTLRDTLLPKLVSGELRVQDDERLFKAVTSRDVARRMRPTELT